MPPPLLPAGAQILQGRYTVTTRGQIGHGEFGDVYEVQSPTGIKFAAKFLNLEGEKEAQARRELDVINSIRQEGGHPNLIRVEEVGEDYGYPVVVMELAQESLDDWNKRVRAEGVSEGERLRRLLFFLRQAADGLDFLGYYKFVHHDVKPANILLVGGNAKLTDFGLARPLSPPVTEKSIGWTPLYAAPEFLEGAGGSQPYTSDQYSLAVTYHLLRTGHLPFKKWKDADAVRKATTPELILAHVENDIDVSSLGTNEGVAVARALSKAPEKRYPSCREFAEAVAKGAEIDSWRPPVGKRTVIKPGVWAAGGLVVVLLAVLAGLLIPPLLGTEASPSSPTGLAREEEVVALRQLVNGQHQQLLTLGKQVDALKAGADYLKLFAAAREAAERREYTTARELLALTRPSDRGIEFAYLDRRLKECEANHDRDPKIMISAPTRQHDGGGKRIERVLFSPDGRHLVTLDGENSVAVRSIDFSTTLRLEKAHTQPIWDMCFNQTGTLFVTAGRDASGHAWKVGDREWKHLGTAFDMKTKGEEPEGGFSSVAFSPDGSVLAFGTQGGTVQMQAVKDDQFTTQVGYSHGPGTNPVLALALTDRETVISGTKNYVGSLAVRHFMFVDGRTKTGHEVSETVRHGVSGLTISADGRRLATWSGDNTVRIWSAKSLGTLREFEFENKWQRVLRAILISTAERLAVRFNDSVWLVDPATGVVLLHLAPPKWEDGVSGGGLSWDTVNRKLAIGYARSVLVWDFAD